MMNSHSCGYFFVILTVRNHVPNGADLIVRYRDIMVNLPYLFRTASLLSILLNHIQSVFFIRTGDKVRRADADRIVACVSNSFCQLIKRDAFEY